VERSTDRSTVLQGVLDRLKAGDEDARQELLGHAYGRLRVLARRKLSKFERREETDVVLHEAVLRLEAALKKVQPDTLAQFFALASKHMRYVLLDLKGGRTHQPLAADVADAGPADSGPGPATAAERRDLLDLLHRRVESLSEDLRQVVDLLYYQGLQQGEAAQVLGVTERHVRRLWRNARLELREALGMELGNESADATD
jgi:RNA polymerase sigma-70 factor (ECF subfamily)